MLILKYLRYECFKLLIKLKCCEPTRKIERRSRRVGEKENQSGTWRLNGLQTFTVYIHRIDWQCAKKNGRFNPTYCIVYKFCDFITFWQLEKRIQHFMYTTHGHSHGIYCARCTYWTRRTHFNKTKIQIDKVVRPICNYIFISRFWKNIVILILFFFLCPLLNAFCLWSFLCVFSAVSFWLTCCYWSILRLATWH